VRAFYFQSSGDASFQRRAYHLLTSDDRGIMMVHYLAGCVPSKRAVNAAAAAAATATAAVASLHGHTQMTASSMGNGIPMSMAYPAADPINIIYQYQNGHLTMVPPLSNGTISMPVYNHQAISYASAYIASSGAMTSASAPVMSMTLPTLSHTISDAALSIDPIDMHHQSSLNTNTNGYLDLPSESIIDSQLSPTPLPIGSDVWSIDSLPSIGLPTLPSISSLSSSVSTSAPSSEWNVPQSHTSVSSTFTFVAPSSSISQPHAKRSYVSSRSPLASSSLSSTRTPTSLGGGGHNNNNSDQHRRPKLSRVLSPATSLTHLTVPFLSASHHHLSNSSSSASRSRSPSPSAVLRSAATGGSRTTTPTGSSSHHQHHGSPPMSPNHQPQIVDYSPSWDYQGGGSKLLLCVVGQFAPTATVRCMFGTTSCIAQEVVAGTYRAIVPAQSQPGVVSFYLTDGCVRTRPQPFEYHSSSMDARSPSGTPHATHGHHHRVTTPSSSPSTSSLRPFPHGSISSGGGTSTIASSPSAVSTRILASNDDTNTNGVDPSTSHEREFMMALLQRLIELEISTTSTVARSSSSTSNREAKTSATTTTPRVSPPSSSSRGTVGTLSSPHSSSLGIIHDDNTEDTNSSTVFTLSDVRDCVMGDGAAVGGDLLEALLLVTLERAQSRGLLTSDVVSRRDVYGRQLLHYISGLGYTHLMLFLRHCPGADVNCRDDRGRTPLHNAALAGDGHMVSALLSEGADEKLVDTNGFSALALADSGESATLSTNGTSNRDGQAVVDVFLDLQNAETPPIDRGGDSKTIKKHDEKESSRTSGGRRNDSSAGRLDDRSEISLGRAFSSMTLRDMGIETSEIDQPDVSDAVFATNVRRIQRKIRWWLYKRQAAAKRLQAMARGMLVRKSMKRMRESALLIQSWARQRRARRDYQRLKQATLTIQTNWRSKHARSASTGAISGVTSSSSSTTLSSSSSSSSAMVHGVNNHHHHHHHHDVNHAEGDSNNNHQMHNNGAHIPSSISSSSMDNDPLYLESARLHSPLPPSPGGWPPPFSPDPHESSSSLLTQQLTPSPPHVTSSSTVPSLLINNSSSSSSILPTNSFLTDSSLPHDHIIDATMDTRHDD
jgi:hypothetical protein